MPVKYHIASSGKPEMCHATVRGCLLGGEHISRAEAVKLKQDGKDNREAFDEVLDQLKSYDDVHYRVKIQHLMNPMPLNSLKIFPIPVGH